MCLECSFGANTMAGTSVPFESIIGSNCSIRVRKPASDLMVYRLCPRRRVFVSRRSGKFGGREKPLHSRHTKLLALQELSREVTVLVERAATRNSRQLFANVDILAPREIVWAALTDYDGLAKFIPGLAENRCLERRPEGALLWQVGEQDIALGAKFRAEVVLDIQEFNTGVPKSLCTYEGASYSSRKATEEGLLPEPRSQVSHGSSQDITFTMVKGDFKAFRGIWRMQSGFPGQTQLSYSLHVQPQAWLPVRLIQGRVEGEVKSNLCAVRNYSEKQWGATRNVSRSK